MTKNKVINLRVTTEQFNKINALKQTKRAKNEVFNLSELLRYELTKKLDNTILQ